MVSLAGAYGEKRFLVAGNTKKRDDATQKIQNKEEELWLIFYALATEVSQTFFLSLLRNLSLQYQYRIKQKSKESKEKIQQGDN